MVKGLHKKSRVAELDRFVDSLGAMEVLPLDTPAAVTAGRIYADLERSGQPIGRADPEHGSKPSLSDHAHEV
ncbi:MAG: hypothetical protein IT384_24650 [Deltaproteobacteria bacterium]|nr:hypothetical protein [Deltaproteobacteria bacterium]